MADIRLVFDHDNYFDLYVFKRRDCDICGEYNQYVRSVTARRMHDLAQVKITFSLPEREYSHVLSMWSKTNSQPKYFELWYQNVLPMIDDIHTKDLYYHPNHYKCRKIHDRLEKMIGETEAVMVYNILKEDDRDTRNLWKLAYNKKYGDLKY